MAYVYEVPETEVMRRHSQLALSWVVSEVRVTHVASAVFARCLVMLEKSFGLKFSNAFGTLEALVSYFKWAGGQPAGKEEFP